MRVVVEHDGVELIAGLEVRSSELAAYFYSVLDTIIEDAIQGIPSTDPDDVFAAAVEAALIANWPDRAYFLEVGRDDRGWIQIFQPLGRSSRTVVTRKR